MKIFLILLLMLAAEASAQTNPVQPKLGLAAGKSHWLKSAAAATGVPGNKSPAPPKGLHGNRNMPPMGENTERPIFAKGGKGLRRMPALGSATDKHPLPIGPSNNAHKLMLGR